jgi:succinate dehydrogenase / fumarate reductase cytochrome b subunit
MNSDFLFRRIHSLTGLIPIGVFLLEHIFSFSQVIAGPAAFNTTVAALQSMPFLVPIEITVIIIPIIFHAAYGLYIVYLAKNNPLSYSYLHNWLFYWQRVTAIITTVFLFWHVWTLRIMGKMVHGAHIDFQYMSNLLTDPVIFTLYAVGLVAAVFHFANGLWAFFITWGITVGARSQRIAYYGCLLLFLVLTSIGLTALTHFAS